jgi:ketosteroid isomerase-like protein
LYQGWEQMEASWKDSFESPKGTYVHSMHQPQVTMLEDNAAVVTYYETVIINPPAVKEQTADQYRVTRVFQKIDGKWLIVHDHASALPMK